MAKNIMYTSEFHNMILDEMMPIIMPYGSGGKIKIFTEEFSAHGEEPDTFAILCFRLPDGQMQEVKRYFKKDPKTGEVMEVGLKEYAYRKRNIIGESGCKND